MSVTITAGNYFLPKPYLNYNYDKKRNELELTGQDAFVVQHEIDHLDGILMTDKKIKNNLFVDEMIKKGEKSENE